jgi:hypothetical protein
MNADQLWRDENRIALKACGLWTAFYREYKIAYAELWNERKARGMYGRAPVIKAAWRRVMKEHPRWEAVTFEECKIKLKAMKPSGPPADWRQDLRRAKLASHHDWLIKHQIARLAITNAFTRLRARKYRPRWRKKIRRAIHMYKRKRSMDDILILLEQHASRLPPNRDPNMYDDVMWVYQNLGLLIRKSQDGTMRINNHVVATAPSSGALSMAAFALSNRREFFSKFVLKMLASAPASSRQDEYEDEDYEDADPVGRSREAEEELEALGALDVPPEKDEPRDQREGITHQKSREDNLVKGRMKRVKRTPPSELDDLSNFPDI